MTAIDARLQDLLAPIRSAGVEALLKALAVALAEGSEVEAEAVRRDDEGRVLRSGPLDLPSRTDLLVGRDGEAAERTVTAEAVPAFEPMTLVADGGFTTVLAPFRWDAATIRVETRREANWQPLRRWYLEWFQPRHGDVAPDLGGLVHGLEGPARPGWVWEMEIDFGSAPTEAVTGFIAAVAASGALRLRIGGTGG